MDRMEVMSETDRAGGCRGFKDLDRFLGVVGKLPVPSVLPEGVLLLELVLTRLTLLGVDLHVESSQFKVHRSNEVICI